VTDETVPLPGIPVSAGALIYDRDGRVAESSSPTYKSGWTIPGGVNGGGRRSPWEACQRRGTEETGLEVSRGRLAAMDFRRPREGRPGGRQVPVRLRAAERQGAGGPEAQPEEISESRLVPLPDALALLRGHQAAGTGGHQGPGPGLPGGTAARTERRGESVRPRRRRACGSGVRAGGRFISSTWRAALVEEQIEAADDDGTRLGCGLGEWGGPGGVHHVERRSGAGAGIPGPFRRKSRRQPAGTVETSRSPSRTSEPNGRRSTSMPAGPRPPAGRRPLARSRTRTTGGREAGRAEGGEGGAGGRARAEDGCRRAARSPRLRARAATMPGTSVL